MIPSACVFKNAHGITIQVACMLVQVGGFRSTVRTVFLIVILLESLNRFKALSKKQHLY